MQFRRLAAVCSLIILGGILAACGSDNDSKPTAVPEVTINPTLPGSLGQPQVQPSIFATPGSDLTESTLPLTTSATPVDTSTVATPVASTISLRPMTGTLTLEGRAQQDYTISAEGCLGLGEWRNLRPGTQVVVSDADGTVVDISELESVDSGDHCVWNIALNVPAEGFFSIRVPMVTEIWFSADDAAVQSGTIELVLP